MTTLARTVCRFNDEKRSTLFRILTPLPRGRDGESSQLSVRQSGCAEEASLARPNTVFADLVLADLTSKSAPRRRSVAHTHTSFEPGQVGLSAFGGMGMGKELGSAAAAVPSRQFELGRMSRGVTVRSAW